MIAILSDVHANLEALTAVYNDLTHRGIRRIFFLGDMVGYGPNPVEVLDFIKHFEFSLLGNHDQACIRGFGEGFNAAAAQSAVWTHRQICPDELKGAFLRPGAYKQRQAQWEYLLKLKPMRTMSQTLFVHDTPAQPGSAKYVLHRSEVDAGFAAWPKMRAFFFGHSHRPGVWTESAYFLAEPGRKFTFDQRVMVNVGSVGQPRDKDPRACYVILEPDGFRFIRVPYDLARTQEKLLACSELAPALAERLAKGI